LHYFTRARSHCTITPPPSSQYSLRDAPKSIASLSNWGFIIYRCDYRIDDAWEHFINQWAAIVKEDVQKSYKDSDKLLRTLDFTVRDDRSSLEGASIDKVRMLHTAWVESDESLAEQMEHAITHTHFLSRYSYCIHVDAASLNSCLNYFSSLQNENPALPGRDPAPGMMPYVNLISTPYPGPLTQEERENVRQQQQEAEEEAMELGWDLTEDRPVFIRAHFPSVPSEIYSEVDSAYDLWAQELGKNSDAVFMP
jgi:hypothetical protein